MSETTPVRAAAPPATSARLSLGRSAQFLSTQAQLQFQLDHARARDAVHDQADFASLSTALTHQGRPPLQLESAIPTGSAARQTYLRRPDLGRRLSPTSSIKLREEVATQTDKPQAAIIIADGLSALAINRHALPLIEALKPHFAEWQLAPTILVRNARVAIGDEIGEALGANLTILLIGERPGLTAPDSLGVYLTWNPHIGCTDADRNCISNIRLEGLSYNDAAQRIAFYANAARSLGRSGFELKDSGSPSLPSVR